jgi:Flp pilus assembly protein protease CpaA
MRLIRFVLRAFLLIAGALLGLGFFLFAVLAFAAVLLVSVLTGRKPDVQFRMNRNPWAQRRAPAPDDVVDIEAREVKDAAPLPLQPPPR